MRQEKASKGSATTNKSAQGQRKVNDKVRFTEKQLSENLRQASRHHIESFDFAMQECLPRICENLLATEISASVLESQAKAAAARGGNNS
jgi:hypothetical protein